MTVPGCTGSLPISANMLTYTILAQAAPAAAPGGGSQMLITMALFMVIFWVLIIRPQKKKQKEHEQRLASIKVGDRIITASGVHGIISAVRDRTISLKIAENVRIDMEKSAIATILPKEGEAAATIEAAKQA